MDYNTLKGLVDQGLSSRKITEYFGCNHSTTQRRLKKYNLKTQHERPKKFVGTEKSCKKCKVVLSLDNFFSSGRLGWYRGSCKTCYLEGIKSKRRNIKIQLINYKGGKCQTCGYDRYAGALNFHRIDFRKKENITTLTGDKSLKKQKEEVDKCILVCANCYRKIKYEGIKNCRERKIKAEFVNEKGGECQTCGYNKYIGALDFHHVDPCTKNFGISSRRMSKERQKEEIDKCILICANCHAEIHSGLIKI